MTHIVRVIKSARRALAPALIAASVMFASGWVSAQEEAKLAELRGALKTLSARDEASIAQDDVARIAGWLDEAKALLDSNDDEEAAYLLKRSEYGLALVAELVKVSQIEARASSQEQAAGQTDAQIEALKAEVEALQAKKSELTQQLNLTR